MATVVWLVEASAVFSCLLVGLVGGGALFCLAVASKAAKDVGRYAPTELGVFELNEFDRVSRAEARSPRRPQHDSRAAVSKGLTLNVR
jgi:hypothetical protein